MSSQGSQNNNLQIRALDLDGGVAGHHRSVAISSISEAAASEASEIRADQTAQVILAAEAASKTQAERMAQEILGDGHSSNKTKISLQVRGAGVGVQPRGTFAPHVVLPMSGHGDERIDSQAHGLKPHTPSEKFAIDLVDGLLGSGSSVWIDVSASSPFLLDLSPGRLPLAKS